MATQRGPQRSGWLFDWCRSPRPVIALVLTTALLFATPGGQSLTRASADEGEASRDLGSLEGQLLDVAEETAERLTDRVTGDDTLGPEKQKRLEDRLDRVYEQLPSSWSEITHTLQNNGSITNTTYQEMQRLADAAGLPTPLISEERLEEVTGSMGLLVYDQFRTVASESGMNTTGWPSYEQIKNQTADDPIEALASSTGVNASALPLGLGVDDPDKVNGKCYRYNSDPDSLIATLLIFLLYLVTIGGCPAALVLAAVILVVLLLVIVVILLVILLAAAIALALAEGAAATASAWAAAQKQALDAFVATQATQTTASAQAAIADLDETRNGVGDSFEDVYDIARTLADPDDDGALTITEFQWNTIPTRGARWGNTLGPLGLPGDQAINQTLGRYAEYPNAPDSDGDAWRDGPEIEYWSRVMGVVFQDRLNATSPVSYSDVRQAWPQDELQGPWSTTTGLAENVAPDPCPHVYPVLDEASEAGTVAIGAIPDEQDVAGSTWGFSTYKDVAEQLKDFSVWGAKTGTGPACGELEFSDRAPSPPGSWMDVISNLNGMTGLAWRHPGYFFDTDGDGYANVRDPDSDNDRLMDGHTLIVDRDDPRYTCYARPQTEDPCPPYDSHPLVNDDTFWNRTFPSELTLGSYPEFTDSDCQATLPGDTIASRCSPNTQPSARGTPGHGDELNDTAEYRYWKSLKDSQRYAAFHPDAVNESHPAEPWNTSYDWDPVENAFLDADSDDDGLLDGEEVRGCRVQNGICEGDVTSTAAWTDDTDGDGLKDAEEDDWGTDATSWDTDGDALPDGWEAWYGLDPTTPQTSSDPDGDGLSNRQEYCTGDSSMPGPTSLCGDEGAAGWTANWCGPNPQVADTDGDGVDDSSDANSTYDCTEPSAIGGTESRAVAPYKEPNQDLGTLDPESEDWLKTGRYAEKAAAHPVNFTNRTLADPVKVAREIQENLTEDTETLTRLVAPPIARHEAWRARETVDRTVETLLACPRPVAVTDASPTEAVPPFPGTVQEATEQVTTRLDSTRNTTDCLADALQRTLDDATQILPTPLISEPVASVERLAGEATEPVPEAPEALERVTSSLPQEEPVTLADPVLNAADTTVGALEDEALQPTVEDPWSLVAEPDAFPNLAADASANRLTPNTLYDQLVEADRALGSQTQLISTADATHWDLLIQFPNRTPQQIQNIPVGTPRPVNLYEDCVPNPTNTSQLENASACATDLADPDLTVELTPQTSGTSLDGYAFTATKHASEPLPVALTALVQVPNREEAFALGVDGRPDAAANLTTNLTTGPIPDEFRFTVEANRSDGQRLSTSLQQSGATDPLVATGGRFAVDTHDPDKPALDEPRTEASAVLFDPPNQLSLTTTQERSQQQEGLEVSWTSSTPTRVAASATTVDPAGTTSSGVLSIDELPTQGTVTLTHSPTATDLTLDTTDASGDVLDELSLHGSIEDATAATSDPTILNARVDDPPQLAHLVLERAPEGTSTELRYDASSAFQQAVVTRFSAGASCPVVPAANLIAVQEDCTHANLTGLQQATVTVADDNLTADWIRATGQGNLSVRVDRAGTSVDALVDPWTRTGGLSARWPTPLNADWSLSTGLDQFLADIETASGTKGLLDLSGLPATGRVDLDLGQRSLDVAPGSPIDRVQARLSTDGQLPPAPTGDHALIDRPDAETLRARLLLHDLDQTHATIGTDNATLALRTSQGRELTIHADTPNANARAHVDAMPPKLVADVARTGSNTTLDLSHTGTQLPTITATGRLENLGFDVALPNLPQSVEGFVDAQGGNMSLDASSAFSVNATLTGDPSSAPPVIPLRGLAPGVSTALEGELGNQQPGIRVDLDNVEHARLNRQPTVPNDPTSPTRFTGEIRLSQPSPLVVSSIEGDATNYAKIEDVPADTNFNVQFNDRGGHFDYDATHAINDLRVARVTPDTFFHAWAQDVPTDITLDWSVPQDLTDGTLTGAFEHAGDTPIPQLGFKWVDDSTPGQRSAKMLAARNVSSTVHLTLEDRQDLSASLGGAGSIDHVAGLFAEGMPPEDVTLPDTGTHGVHLQRLSEDRRSFAARFSGLGDIREARIPTSTQPTFNLEVDLGDAKPFELYVDDRASDLRANATIAQLGGGTVELDGRLALSGDPTEATLNADLPTALERASIHFSNATTWFAGDVATQATAFNLSVSPPAVHFDANQPIDVTLRGAPNGGSAPAGPAQGNFAKIDLRDTAPRVSARADGLEQLDFEPRGPGRLAWDAASAQPFNATVYTTNWTIRNAYADPLAQTGTVTWNTTDGFTGDFSLSSPLDKLRLNLAHTPVDGKPVQADALLKNVGGSGSITFAPDEAARLDVPAGIGDVRAEVFLNASQELDLTTLDETLGLAFDDPAPSENAAYDTAVAVNLTDVTALDSTLRTPEPGGLKVNGTLTLEQAIEDGLRLRANTPGGWVDANTTNLPAETTFRIDNHNVTGPDGDKLPLRVDLDWGTDPIRRVDAAFRAYADASQQNDDASGDQRGTDRDRQGNVTAYRVRNLTLEKQGTLGERLTGHVGGDLEHVFARLDAGQNRTRAAVHEVDGVYDVTLEDNATAGTVQLASGTPADSVRIVHKAKNATTKTPSEKKLAEHDPQWLFAEKDPANARFAYAHLRVKEPTLVDWASHGNTGFEATFETSPPGERTYVRFHNGTQHVNATIEALPASTSLTFSSADNTTRAGLNVNEPVNVPLISYRETAPEGVGVPAQDGTPVNVSLTAKQIGGLESTTFTLTSRTANAANLTVDTDGLDRARLFGVFRGDESAPGEGKHVLTELSGVPTTQANIVYNASQALTGSTNDEAVPFVAVDSTTPVDRIRAAFLSPVAREPEAITLPDEREFLNVETRANETVQADEQLFVQADVSNVEAAGVDPTTPLDDCSACTPVTVELTRGTAGGPLYANLNASMLPVTGTVNITKTPQQMQLGFATNETTIQTDDGPETVTTDAIVDYDASGPISELDADLTATLNGTSTRFNATVGTFPSSAKVEVHREPHPAGQVQTACGLPLAQKVPGRIDVTSDVNSPIEDLNVSVLPDQAGQGPLSPDQATNYIGYQHDDTAWSVRALFDTVHDVSLYADPTAQDTPILSATGTLEGTRDFAFEYIDPVTEDESGDQARDRIVRGTLEGTSWPIHAECHGDRLQAWPGTESTVDDTRGIEQIHVAGANLSLMNRTASGLEATVTDLDGGATIDLGVLDENNGAIENKTGFAVHPVGDASLNEVDLDLAWDPSSVDRPAHCSGSTQQASEGETTDVQVTLPIDLVNVTLSTHDAFQAPQTPNRLTRIRTCEQDTLDVRLHNLEDVHIKRESQDDDCKPLTQLWINTTHRRNTDLWLEGWDCKDETITKRRVKIHPLPTTFWIKTPVPGAFDRDGALFDASGTIGYFAYIKNDCLQLWEDNLKPESAENQILGVDEALEGLGRSTGCSLEGSSRPTSPDPSIRTGQFVARGIVEVAEIGVKITDGSKRLVDGLWHGVTSNVGVAWDVDGYSKQRDQPRFTGFDGTFKSHRIEIRNTESDRGTVIDLTQFADLGGVTVDAQGQWYPSPRGSPSDTLVPGTVDVPDRLMERKCLEWNETAGTCEDRESWSEARARLAKSYFTHKAKIGDGGWEWLPPRVWEDAIT